MHSVSAVHSRVPLPSIPRRRLAADVEDRRQLRVADARTLGRSANSSIGTRRRGVCNGGLYMTLPTLSSATENALVPVKQASAELLPVSIVDEIEARW